MNKDTWIGILGYAREGQDTEAYLLSHGFTNVTILDNNPETKSLLGNPVITGQDALGRAHEFEVIFRTPGIKLRSQELQDAIAEGTVITSQAEYFIQHAKGKTIGITGTKGKSTTSTLTYEFLKEAGRDVHLVGNIGKSMLSLLDSLTEKSVTVLELSSFQLQDIKASPGIAIMLAITPEHLDYHGSMEEYVEAKAGITANQTADDLFIYNMDNAYSRSIGEHSVATRFPFSTQQEEIGLAHAGNDAFSIGIGGKTTRIPFNEVALLGNHHRQNILPAIVAALSSGAQEKDIVEVLRRFKGLPYRMQYIGNYGGMDFYNDSLATTPEASIAALHSLHTPTILILGGGDKGVAFDDLAEELSEDPHLRYIILIGNDSAKRIDASLRETRSSRFVYEKELMDDQIGIVSLDSYQQLYSTIKSIGQDGMNVLLSPACSSFDFFKDYKERGDFFNEVARRFG